MRAEIHQLRPKPVTITWMCSACGVDAGCNCGAPLMSKAQRAKEAIEANPQKSNRAIAEDAGVSYETVRRARTDTDVSVDDEPRVGLDGKQRRMPKRAARGSSISSRARRVLVRVCLARPKLKFATTRVTVVTVTVTYGYGSTGYGSYVTVYPPLEGVTYVTHRNCQAASPYRSPSASPMTLITSSSTLRGSR